MAKMTMEFDTLTKKVTAAIDGNSVENVMGMEVYMSYDGDFRCSFCTCKNDKESGISEMTSIYASESYEGKAAMSTLDGKASASTKHVGFVEVNEGKAVATEMQIDIEKFFEKRPR